MTQTDIEAKLTAIIQLCFQKKVFSHADFEIAASDAKKRLEQELQRNPRQSERSLLSEMLGLGAQ